MAHKLYTNSSYIIKYILILPIKLYKWFISPLLPQTCRHTPTCSTYAINAITTHGPLKGLWIGTKRIVKCHPWGSSGYDPVPPKAKKNNSNNNI